MRDKGTVNHPSGADLCWYRSLISSLPLGFAHVDREGIILDFNRAAEEISGYQREEVVGRPSVDLFHCTSDPEGIPPLPKVLLEKRKVVGRETEITNKRGDRIVLAVSAAPVFDNAGAMSGAVGLFHDITEMKRQERARKNILSMFAHDMKNPLSTAGGALTYLLEGGGDRADTRQQMLEIIREELHKLSGLVGDFLEFSRIEAKQFRPARRPVAIEQLLRQTVEIAQPEAKRMRMAVRFDVDGAIPESIPADPAMISRAATNILNNALAHAGEGSSVILRLNGMDEHVHISVTDNGKGIEADKVPHLFDAFYRSSKDSQSSGLGLYIVKTIVEAHGGRIWVESAPGAGSTFHFTLPAHRGP